MPTPAAPTPAAAAEALRLPGPRPPLTPAAAVEIVVAADAAVAVLVEGWSDQAAVETLLARSGIDLGGARVAVVPIGGATNLRAFVQALAAARPRLRLGGLYDTAERDHVRRALGPLAAAAGLEAAGFFACDRDLEDELIRALGVDGVEAVLGADGELASFRRFQAQPLQRGRPPADQLRRFLGTRSGRKVRYGALLAAALPADRVPPALRQLMRHAAAA